MWAWFSPDIDQNVTLKVDESLENISHCLCCGMGNVERQHQKLAV